MNAIEALRRFVAGETVEDFWLQHFRREDWVKHGKVTGVGRVALAEAEASAYPVPECELFATYAEEDVPAEYRHDGKRDGMVLSIRNILGPLQDFWLFQESRTHLRLRFERAGVPRVRMEGRGSPVAYEYKALLAEQKKDSDRTRDDLV